MFEDTIEKESSSSSEESLQLVSFELSGGEEFGVDIMQVSEIIPISKITRIPQAPECVKGLINLRGGKIVVVIDLNRRLVSAPEKVTAFLKLL